MKNAIYVVTMYKFGERNNHSYVLAATLKKHKAIMMAEKEEQNSDEKYKAEIIEFVGDSGKVIYELKQSSWVG